MKANLAVLIVAALAVTALAGTNPDVRIYLDVDPPFGVHEIHPNPGSTVDVYVCLDCLGEGSGVRGTAFLLERTFVGFKLAQTSLWPGLDFGDAEVDGWTMAFDDCAFPDADGIVCIGVIQYLYQGPDPGTIDILPHPGTGAEVLDCDYASDYFCVAANLGVSMPPNPGDPDCDCEPPAPVEDATWGGIKSLYR